MSQDVLYEVDGDVALVTLNRPQYRNAQSWSLLDQLDEALDRAVENSAVRVIVVRGAGPHFSSGHDLGTPEQIADKNTRGVPDDGLEFYEAFRYYNLDITVKWRNLPKPTIAMVTGYCIYGGWMIAAAMDVIFAAPDARFLAGQVEYFSVPFDVGFRKAKELLFESRFIDAEEAHVEGHRGVRGVPEVQPRPHPQVAQPSEAHDRRPLRLLSRRRTRASPRVPLPSGGSRPIRRHSETM